MTRSSAWISAGVPIAIGTPKSSTRTRSATCMTMPMSCSTSSTVRSRSARTRRTSSRDLGALGGVHAGDRLVEQHQARLHREAARELDALAVAVGQQLDLGRRRASASPTNSSASSAAARCRRSSRAPGRARRAARRSASGGGGRRARSRAPSGGRRRRGSGSCARRRCPASWSGRSAQEVAAVEAHAAGVRLVHARERVEERALAGAVRADDREQLAAPRRRS